MSQEETASASKSSRKRNAEDAELEIDISAPEPPSKKALRKAKKTKDTADDPTTTLKSGAKNEQPEFSNLSAPDAKRSDYGVWIGNLSFTTTKQDVLNFLTGDDELAISKDEITRLHLPMSMERKGQNKGFAYVDFKSAESTATALELSETLLGGRRVLIKDAKNFEGRPQSKKGEPAVEEKAPSNRVFIGNLSFETTKEQLQNHFAICGPISDIQVATFQDSGKCKGYAWVEFEQLSAAATAMRGWTETTKNTADSDGSKGGKRKVWLNTINARRLRMEFAEDKTTRYNKRFGKASGKTNGEDGGTIENNITTGEEQTEGIVELPDAPQSSKGPVRDKRVDRKPKKDSFNSRYATETVQKLTGAIVEGKGNKVVFE